MTDTTDNKALSEQFKSIRDDVEFYEGTQHCIAVPIKLAKALLDQLEAAEKKNALVAGGIEAALKTQERLEAERQRAAGSEEGLHKALHREKAAERKLLAAQGEIAAMKTDIESYINIGSELATEVEALKAKLANPVVLPERKSAEWYVDAEFGNDDLAAIYNAAILELKVKIHAAGFTTVRGD